MSSNLHDGGSAGPWIGSLLRRGWETVRDRIYSGLRAAGYDDLSRAHIGMFRFETLDGHRPTRIAERMNVTKQSVNDLLRDLERMGYLGLHPDPADSRARLVRLTPRGQRLDAAVRAEARAAERELAAMLGVRRFNALRDALLTLSPTADAGGPAGRLRTMRRCSAPDPRRRTQTRAGRRALSGS